LNAFPFPINITKHLPLISKVKDWEVRPTPEFFFNPRLTKKVQPAKYGRALYNILKNSQISINIHGQVDANYGQAKFAAGNIRLFEATGCGACLLTDQLPHLEEFFEPDKEIVTFANRQEAIEKTRFLMDSPLERESIARAGHARAWKDYGSKTRAKQFCEILNENV
jgi:spore maturation protein CgeB